MEWEDNPPPFELPFGAQMMLAFGVAVLLSPPAIVIGVAVNAYRKLRR